MKALLEEIEAALPLMKWEKTVQDQAPKAPAMNHFTGRGEKWVVQLVTLDDGQRMGAASAGSVVCRLTDELAERAETVAREALR